MKPEPRGRDFRIGDVLHDAWAFDPKLWRGGRMGVHVYRPRVEPLIEELAEHLSASDVVELRRLVAELQRRFERRFGDPTDSFP
jgi:hypothetical protein